MNVTDKQSKSLHQSLPIDDDEEVLAMYKHHWFAYASLWVIAITMVFVLIGLAAFLVVIGGGNAASASYKSVVMGGAVVLAAVILLFTLIPAWLKSQEYLVLTDEALLQVLQPSLFSSKVDQLNLQRIDDVSVSQDFFGTILGYGKLTVETPGEQNNYDFTMLPTAREAAREISQARENYEAAIQGGHMPTTLGIAQTPSPVVDPAQYQQFLAYQQMLAQQNQEKVQQSETAEANDPTKQA